MTNIICFARGRRKIFAPFPFVFRPRAATLGCVTTSKFRIRRGDFSSPIQLQGCIGGKKRLMADEQPRLSRGGKSGSVAAIEK